MYEHRYGAGIPGAEDARGVVARWLVLCELSAAGATSEGFVEHAVEVSEGVVEEGCKRHDDDEMLDVLSFGF